MGIEIERKFLVKDSWIPLKKDSVKNEIKQGVLSDNPNRFVRVRYSKWEEYQVEYGYLTIKGPKVGLTCQEWEYKIPPSEALELLELCVDVVEKDRYKILYEEPSGRDLFWEVDVFHKLNHGLIMAEIEIPSEDFDLQLPPWVSEEVSTDPRYLNSYLGKVPFQTWN